jgi:hypothetical protein
VSDAEPEGVQPAAEPAEPEPEPEDAPPSVPDDWLEQKPFDPAGR